MPVSERCPAAAPFFGDFALLFVVRFDAELPWPLISNVCAMAIPLASSAQHAMYPEILAIILGPSEKIAAVPPATRSDAYWLATVGHESSCWVAHPAAKVEPFYIHNQQTSNLRVNLIRLS